MNRYNLFLYTLFRDTLYIEVGMSLEKKLNEILKILDQIDERINKIDQKFDKVDAKIDNLESKFK